MGGLSGIQTWLVPTCSNRIASSSTSSVAGVGERCEVVGVGFSYVLDAARPSRLSISFLILSAYRFSRASRFMLRMTIVGSGTSVWAWGSVAALGP